VSAGHEAAGCRAEPCHSTYRYNSGSSRGAAPSGSRGCWRFGCGFGTAEATSRRGRRGGRRFGSCRSVGVAASRARLGWRGIRTARRSTCLHLRRGRPRRGGGGSTRTVLARREGGFGGVACPASLEVRKQRGEVEVSLGWEIASQLFYRAVKARKPSWANVIERSCRVVGAPWRNDDDLKQVGRGKKCSKTPGSCHRRRKTGEIGQNQKATAMSAVPRRRKARLV
jgi:hypothetical protein